MPDFCAAKNRGLEISVPIPCRRALEICRHSSKSFLSQNERSQEDDMSDLPHRFDENVYDLNAILHPGSVFDHPRGVVSIPRQSRGL
jgi:hypothetical protein